MSVALDVVRRFDGSKNIFLDAFILARLIKIQPYYFSLLVKFKQYFIHSAVGYCADYVTVRRCIGILIKIDTEFKKSLVNMYQNGKSQTQIAR